MLAEILHSCTHGPVAAAAVASIGGDFAAAVRSRAEGEGVSVGDFTARQVRQFSGQADEQARQSLEARMQGRDLALLQGLETLMRQMMAVKQGFEPGGSVG